MKKIDTNELRAQLDTFSPEQQSEHDRALLNQYINVFRTLSGVVEHSVHHFKDISEQVNSSTAKVEQILPALKAANMVRVLLVLVIYANMMFVHSGVLWVILGCGFGLEVFVWLVVWYLRRKGWV